MNALVSTVHGLRGHVGAELGPTDWEPMTQEIVDAFADLTRDHNFIHVDPARAAATRFGGTIAHGYLTAAFLAPFVDELIEVTDYATSINYGFDRLRFPGPLRVGARFRGAARIAELTEIEGGVQLHVDFTIEVEGATRPALVARCLYRYYQ